MTGWTHDVSLKRWSLYALIGSVGISALLGVGALVMGDFGEVEVKMLLTTLTIAAASICGLSCGAALEAGRARLVPLAGIGLSLLGALLLILALWGEFSDHEFWKATASIITVGIACSHISLLLLARLSERFQWSLVTAHATIFIVAFMLVAMLWGDFDDEGAFRVLGVASILAAANTILIPVFHRLSRGDLGASMESSVAEIDAEILRLERQLAKLRHRRDTILAGDRMTQPTAGPVG